MAALIESITVPRSSPLLTNPSVPVISSSSISASYGSRKSTSSFPGFKGLKIQSPKRTLASSVGFRNHSVIRRQGIVCEAQETALQVPSVTDSSWKTEVLDSDLPVLVEFWAPWCGPCRMIHPVVGELSKEFTGKLKCYNLNTDESPTIATEYGIRSIPTIIIFKNGEKKDAIIGAVPKTTLTATIEKFL